MKSRIKCLVIFLCLLIAFSVTAVIFWPITCSDMIQPDHGNITVYVVTPIFSSSNAMPTFTSEQWTIPHDSKEYTEMLKIMDEYHCHRKIGSIEQDNHQSWINMYSESGILIFEYRGTDDFKVGNTHYSLYGEGSGQAMMNAIYAILLNNKKG